MTPPGGMASDYDDDPHRFASNKRATALYSRAGDIYPIVAGRFADIDGVELVADLGGGTGDLADELVARGMRAVVIDRAEHVSRARRPAIRADLRWLPLRDASVDAAACLWVLYHFDAPADVLREAARVLRPGGWFVAATSSRSNDPELSDVLPGWGAPTTFDAEDAPDIVGQFLAVESVTRWNAPMIHLPDREATALFLRGRGLDERAARRGADRLPVPLDITKRGALVWARARP